MESITLTATQIAGLTEAVAARAASFPAHMNWEWLDYEAWPEGYASLISDLSARELGDIAGKRAYG